jgi:hypothetical protein
MNRPTGIIRTLPWYSDRHRAIDGQQFDANKRKAFDRMMRGFKAMERSDSASIIVSLAQRPVHEVLHCYIIIGNIVRVRATISRFIPGEEQGDVTCWDESERYSKWWAELTAPVSWPPEEIRWRGFQGFRYVYAELW